ncbi:hypothetical protein [Geodermatophilus sp. CPCC 206100]|uniref:hypothetical protein n=1 Tax=Geodermatophilus sp. CPCC 206100 TaxID=3020054 RepID=UPI003AFF909C
MSATARAPGPAPEDRSVPPRPRPAPRAVPAGRAAPTGKAAAPGKGTTTGKAAPGTATTTGKAAPGKAAPGKATAAGTAGASAPGTTPAPARPLRAHTAPVRTGGLRARPAARATPTGPVPRPATAATPGRARRTAPAEAGRRAPFVLLVVGLLVATTLGLLFLNTAIAVNSLKATQLRAANADRAQEVQRLEQQVVSGGTPAQLAEDAAEAGLVPAGAAGYLVIGEDGSVTLRGEPAPAGSPEDPADSGD